VTALADIFAAVRLQLDGTGFDAQALALADRSGKNVGDRMSANINASIQKAARGAAGALAGLSLGEAISGATKLNELAGEYQVQTGANAQEAKAFSAVLNGLFANAHQSYDEIAQVLIGLKTHFNLDAEAAKALASNVLDFAEVAGGSGADAVERLNSLVKTGVIGQDQMAATMDKLTLAHQKWGININDTLDALVKFAPAMNALNMTGDEAIAWMSLFNKAGVDAQRVTMGFNTAIKQVKSPEEFRRLVADIANTTDDLERAKKASDLFGQRAGSALANMLRPGAQSVQDMAAIIGSDYTGAVEQAAKVNDSTFGGQALLMLHKFQAGLADIGTNMGDLLVVTALIGPGLTKGILAGLGGLAGLLLPRIAAELGLTLPAWIAGGTAAGAAEGAAEAAAVAASGPEVAAAVASQTPEVVAAAAASGTAAGSALASAAAAAVAAAVALGQIVIPVEVLLAANDAAGRRQSNIDDVAAALASGSADQMRQLRDRLQARMAQLPSITNPGSWLGGPSPQEYATASQGVAALNDALARMQAAAAETSQRAGKLLDDGAASAMAGAASAVSSASSALSAAVADSNRKAFFHGGTVAREQAVAGAVAAIAAERQAIIAGKASLSSAWSTARAAAQSAENAADQIIINNADIVAQKKILADRKATDAQKAEARIRIRDLRDSNKEMLLEQAATGTRQQQIAKTQALLTSHDLVLGLKSADPDVQQHWADVKQATEDQLAKLRDDATGYGAAITKALATGIESPGATGALDSSLIVIAGKVRNYLRVRSPAKEGPLSEGRGPSDYGARLVELFASGMESAISHVASAASAVASSSVPVPAAAARNQQITIESVSIADAHDEFSLVQQLRFLAAVQG
jgi:hypothetical protein